MGVLWLDYRPVRLILGEKLSVRTSNTRYALCFCGSGRLYLLALGGSGNRPIIGTVGETFKRVRNTRQIARQLVNGAGSLHHDNPFSAEI